MNNILRALFNTRAAAFYLIAFALAIGVATFIENDFGTSTAQKLIYKAKWFELLLVLFSGSLIYNIVIFRMVQMKKWALLSFHLSIVIIIIGSAITRYASFEGMMPIREQSNSNTFFSSESFLQLKVNQTAKNAYLIQEPLLISALGENSFSRKYLIGEEVLKVHLKEVIANPQETIVEDHMSGPLLHIVLAGNGGRENYYLKPGEVKQIGNEVFNFSLKEVPGAHTIRMKGDEPYFFPAKNMSVMTMATQQKDTLTPEMPAAPLKLRSLHATNETQFVFKDFKLHASVKTISAQKKITNESTIRLALELEYEGKTSLVYVDGQNGSTGNPITVQIGSTSFDISYGPIAKTLPFSIALKDFQMERYPGTNSAVSYASEVLVKDIEKGVQFDYRIYMNHILNYRGYRFFQSSFDTDEKGTYLSVNHDFWGTWVSYLGYALLSLGMVLTFFHKQSRMQYLAKKLKELRKASLIILLISLFSEKAIAQSKEHAAIFSTVIVQDMQGRMKPMHTLSREIMRKLYGKESYEGMNADQVVLNMYFQNQDWAYKPIIKIGEQTKKYLELEGKYASYVDFFNKNGTYKLAAKLDTIFALQPVNQTVGDKELIKVDERLNILNMVFSGSIFKIIPIKGDANNTWTGAQVQHHYADEHQHGLSTATLFFNKYAEYMKHALHSGDFSKPNELLQDLKTFQQKEAASILPSSTKVKAEIILNESNVFGRLALFNLLLGMVYLSLLFLSVFKSNFKSIQLSRILFLLLFIGFSLHTIGLGLRWYVSGRAPWSNGYESMIYIAWTTTLAGLIFARKSLGGLAATLTLSAIVLLIALLSYLDPEITPLVPVLKSYWLTIHVSLEAGSYGFLVLGAIIGIINLLLLSFANQKNQQHIKRVVTELSYLSEMILLGGILMLSTGTYLGGIWANESWGRYWGWDAKETWALVSILVYAFILHMRLVPGLKGHYAFNVASLFGLASIIMTYFGVNYYLSGLHSYAAGDPIPMPTWVYVLTASLLALSVFAYRGWKQLK